MAKFPPYRLQTLFDIREREKKSAEELYASKKQIVDQEEKKLAQMEDELKAMKAFQEQKKHEYFEQMRARISTIKQINENDLHVKALKIQEQKFASEIDLQKIVLNKAIHALDTALQELTKATQDFKALEKHKEKWLKEVKKQIEKKEEDAAEDISQAQYFQNLKDQRK